MGLSGPLLGNTWYMSKITIAGSLFWGLLPKDHQRASRGAVDLKELRSGVGERARHEELQGGVRNHRNGSDYDLFSLEITQVMMRPPRSYRGILSCFDCRCPLYEAFSGKHYTMRFKHQIKKLIIHDWFELAE